MKQFVSNIDRLTTRLIFVFTVVERTYFFPTWGASSGDIVPYELTADLLLLVYFSSVVTKKCRCRNCKQCVCSPERAEVYFLTVKLPGSCLGDNSCDDGIKPRDQNTKIDISLKRPIFYVSCMYRTNQTALISIRMTSPEAYLRGGLCWADGAGEWSDVGQRPASWTGMQPLSQTTVRCRSACSAAIMAPVVSHVRTTERHTADLNERRAEWSNNRLMSDSVWTAAFNKSLFLGILQIWWVAAQNFMF